MTSYTTHIESEITMTLTPNVLTTELRDLLYYPYWSEIAMMLTRKVLTTELRDLLYYPCIDKRCYLFFICPTGRIRVCKRRFVSSGENRRKPCLVCKKCFVHFQNQFYLIHCHLLLEFMITIRTPNSWDFLSSVNSFLKYACAAIQ